MADRAVDMAMSVMSDIRVEALEWANYRCEWPHCERTQWLETAHIIPKGSGGADTLENVWILCKPCHDLYDGRSPFKRREMRLLVVELMRLKRGE